MMGLRIAAAAIAATLPALPASAAEPVDAPAAAEPSIDKAQIARAALPTLLDAGQNAGYRAVFAAIRESRWQDAQLILDAMAPGPLHAIARAELYTAKGSPKVAVEQITAVLNQAPELPQAVELARIAGARGAVDLPPLPVAQRLIWQDGAPRRVHVKATRDDLVASGLAIRMQPLVKADDGAGAQALLEGTGGLGPDALTEWQARVAWMYFLQGDDINARTMAAKAAAGAGEWAVQGRWTGALSAWRQHDCTAAEAEFEATAAQASDVDLRAAGMYWAARADMACQRPDRIEARLKAASQYGESFYGQLARQALGLRDRKPAGNQLVASDWLALERRPNVRVAAALVEIGETDLADDVVRQQAKIGDPREFAGLLRLAETMSLPATTVWLAHNCPSGFSPGMEARYPAPNWTPDSGWRVEKALVYAHALEESRFRSTALSPAGAYGLMQIVPAAATDYGRERGITVDKAGLAKPSTNIDIGQRHLERLRDMAGTTGGLLPKVMAAYNAGPKPVGEWNYLIRDGGDPLLYIESIPYWETRGYVTTVMRNYWMYEAGAGQKVSSRAALAQGMWPRFPGLPGAAAVRIATPIRPFVRATPMTVAAPATATAANTNTIALSAPVAPRSTTVTRAD